MTSITYTSPPVCGNFMRSEAFIRMIPGPVGSGKTTACLMELFRRAAEQHPSPDGYRHTRFAILRQTLSQLKQTVLKDILQWLQGIATWRVSENTIFVQIGDIKSEWILLPLEDIEDQRRLLSSQLTGAWISECIEIDADLVSAVAGRCGRYPGGNLGGATWSGIIMDTNFPEEGSDWWELMENPPPDWQVFPQPGGLTEQAENLSWLLQTPDTLKQPEGHPDRIARGRMYYERLARGNSPEWVKRYVHAQYGIDPSGTAVFASTFLPKNQYGPWHVVPSIEPVSGMALIVGQDFGRDPCAVICQVDHNGRLLVLEEVISNKMGLELHVGTRLRPTLMAERYRGYGIAVVGDPAGIAKGNIHEQTSFDFLRSAGFHAFPASTNDIDPRIRAVEGWLLSARAGGAGMLIDASRCPELVRALQGGYRFENTPKTGEMKVKPLKNKYSHVADALQYACLAAQAGALGVINRTMMRPRRVSRGISALGWT